MSIIAAVVGASGITGGELCRLLLGHNSIGEIWPVTRKPLDFEACHPNLLGSGLKLLSFEDFVHRPAPDVVFTCLPAGESMSLVADFLAHGSVVIDLGPDFRFENPSLYQSVYGRSHCEPGLLGHAVYGLTELYRKQLPSARLVSNPGCYVSAVLLALAPLTANASLRWDWPIRVHAVNGTTGADPSPRAETHHARVVGGLLPYSLHGHRHAPEIEHRLELLRGQKVAVDLVTSHGDFARGIAAYISVDVAPERRNDFSRESLREQFVDFWAHHSPPGYFIKVVSPPVKGGGGDKNYADYPNPARVVGSNACHLGVDYDVAHGVVRIVSVIDNLGKGAAGSAVQNMNVIFDFDEGAGLCRYGL